MEISVLEIALQRINEGDDISNTLLISVRDAVLELFCHEQLNCNEAENEIFKIDLISLDQKSRKDYIINLSSFLIEKKDLETPGYFNYFYNKFKSTLSMINENKGTVAIGIAVIVLGASMVNQHYKLNELTETVSFQNKSIERQMKENAILQKKIQDQNVFEDKLQNYEFKVLSKKVNDLTENYNQKNELLENFKNLKEDLNSKILSEDDIKKIIQDVKDNRTFYQSLSENGISLITTTLNTALSYNLLPKLI